jgi:predicted DsbA family dithiol-disulfide isomerase
MIDPGTHPNGETMEEYCKRRWGGSGWTNHLKSEGRKDGANFSNWKWWPNTSKAHQLVEYCAANNVCSTDRINELLFQAEYERGKNLSLVSDLVDVAKDAGVANLDDVRTYLEQDNGKDIVKQQIAQGRQRYGISGVPFFIVSSAKDSNKQRRPYGFSGAQSSDTFVELFEELAEQN